MPREPQVTRACYAIGSGNLQCVTRHEARVLEPLAEVEHDRGLCPMSLECLAAGISVR